MDNDGIIDMVDVFEDIVVNVWLDVECANDIEGAELHVVSGGAWFKFDAKEVVDFAVRAKAADAGIAGEREVGDTCIFFGGEHVTTDAYTFAV